MDENLDQCTDKTESTAKSDDMACNNQEKPEDLKEKLNSQAEARKLGITPSSLDLPKINLADFDKWNAILNQNKVELPEQNASKTEPQVCQEEIDNTPPMPEKIVAYDDKGEKHEFENEPIETVPPDFSKVPEWRQKQLDTDAKEILDKYSAPAGDDEDPSMDFQKIADMQKEIAARQDLTETEKCLLYSKIQVNMREGGMTVENWNEKPEMIDSWTGQHDPWHAVAPIDDKYHNRLTNMTPEESSAAIQEQEDHTEGDMHDSWYKRWAWKGMREVMGINQGDINASEAQVKCMRQMREKGTFGAYAEEWEKQYVNKGAVNPRDVDPQGGQQGAGPVGVGGSGGARGY